MKPTATQHRMEAVMVAVMVAVMETAATSAPSSGSLLEVSRARTANGALLMSGFDAAQSWGGGSMKHQRVTSCAAR